MENAQHEAAEGRPATSDPRAGRKRTRRWLLWLLVIVVLLGGAAWTTWYMLDGRWYERTDDAYVTGNIVQITSRMAGTVVSIRADDNDYVERGQPLVVLDAADADVALEQARAALGQAVRRVDGQFGVVDTARAQIEVTKASVERARSDYQRRKALANSGAVSTEELAHAEEQLASAESQLSAAQAQLATAQAQVSGTRVENHPDVLAAAARLRKVWLDRQRVELPAPVSGFVAKRSVQLGQHVDPGTPLMAVVPLDSVWVDANFKETQLRHMRIGQPVTLQADLYGREVNYHGQIVGLGVGTGSAFSLLPAQNATGNWIKIVQRLPVRIALQADELRQHPLRIGLSMRTRVELRDQTGPVLSAQPVAQSALDTTVYDIDEAGLRAMTDAIIEANRSH